MTACRIEAMSTWQVEIWNSERRRRALVRSCACMRLESAMRTAIADGTATEDRLMKQAPDETELSNVLMVGARGGVLKQTGHIIRGRFSNRENRGSGCGKPTTSKNCCFAGFDEFRGIPADGGFSPRLPAFSSRLTCDGVNTQVYFGG